MQIQPYLFFEGTCEEALGFYRETLGAEVEMSMRYDESTEAPPGMVPQGWDKKVMHASFRIGEMELMASDGCTESPAFAGFSLSLTVPDIAAANRVFDALADGGQVEMPLGETFGSPRFGMLRDRFGDGWKVSVAPGAR
jgi:PhnB protein